VSFLRKIVAMLLGRKPKPSKDASIYPMF